MIKKPQRAYRQGVVVIMQHCSFNYYETNLMVTYFSPQNCNHKQLVVRTSPLSSVICENTGTINKLFLEF